MRRNTTVMIKEVPKDLFVAELSCGDTLFGLLSFRKGTFSLEIYPSANGKWELDADDFIFLIEEGKKELRERFDALK